VAIENRRRELINFRPGHVNVLFFLLHHCRRQSVIRPLRLMEKVLMHFHCRKRKLSSVVNYNEKMGI